MINYFAFQVNIKEQGRLLRQDNFTVWNGKKKHQRRVFLFEDLVLFTKPKKQQGCVDLFFHKNSLKVFYVFMISLLSNSARSPVLVSLWRNILLYFLEFYILHFSNFFWKIYLSMWFAVDFCCSRYLENTGRIVLAIIYQPLLCLIRWKQ